jgi:hypothetical protein
MYSSLLLGGQFPHARATFTLQPRAVARLPTDVYATLCASDLGNYVHLPMVCREMSLSMAQPLLRCRCLLAVMEAAAVEDEAAPGQLDQQLARRARAMRLRRYVHSVARHALAHRDIEVLVQCVEKFGLDINRRWEDGASVLQQCMKRDFAAGVEFVLRHPATLLPSWQTPLSMVQQTKDGPRSDPLVVVAAQPDRAGRHVLQLARAGAQLSDFNPLFLGVLHHAEAATRTCLRVLRGLPRVRVGSAAHPSMAVCEPGEISGERYVRGALGEAYQCCGSLALPSFDCAFGFGAFHAAMPPGFLSDLSRARGRRWSLLQLEMRRPDTRPAVVALLLRALAGPAAALSPDEPAAASFARAVGIPGPALDPVSPLAGAAYTARDHPDREHLRKLLLAKRQAIAVMRENAEDPDAALQAAVGRALEQMRIADDEARRGASSKDAPRDAPPAAAPPSAPADAKSLVALKQAGWYGVNGAPERVAQFEAAAAMIEAAFSLGPHASHAPGAATLPGAGDKAVWSAIFRS